MNQPELFLASEKALTAIVSQIRDDQWDLKAPKEMVFDGTDKWTVRSLINYHAYDDAWVPDVLAGKTKEEVGTKYDGDLLGANPMESWNAIVDKASNAAKNADLKMNVHLSYGDFPAEEYLYHISLFRTLRTVDFARFLGFDDTLPEDLAQGMYKYVMKNEDYLRNIGVIGTAIEVPSDALYFERLMGVTGREPHK